MGISEVCSPVTRKGSKVSGNTGLSPGARSDPGRVGGPKFDSVPTQHPHAKVSLGQEGEPASVEIVGPSTKDL